MDWFETLTGFREADYNATRTKLIVQGKQLRSLVNGASYGIGELELASLESLRQRARSDGGARARVRAQVVTGDVRRMHRLAENAGALFQVASQFNLLEMVSPSVTPEQGVTRYEQDRTQGPACAIAAGAATIYRNYFVPVSDDYGQTAERQIDGLADMGGAFSRVLNMPVESLWRMQNGYALCTRQGLAAIARHLDSVAPEQIDSLRSRLRIGLHWDVEATEGTESGPELSQAFCSALPVTYTNVPAGDWAPFAALVLEAAYEATLWAGVFNAQRGASNIVFLTFVGGGAFGNDEAWIHSAIQRALRIVVDFDLDVRLVSYGPPSPTVLQLAKEFQ